MHNILEGRSRTKSVDPSLCMQINRIALLTDYTERMAVGVWCCINSFNNINIQLIRYHYYAMNKEVQWGGIWFGKWRNERNTIQPWVITSTGQMQTDAHVRPQGHYKVHSSVVSAI